MVLDDYFSFYKRYIKPAVSHQHIKFDPEFVKADDLNDFAQHETFHEAQLNTYYDIKSITHFSSWEKSKIGPVLLTKSGHTIYPATRASSMDQYRLCLMYQCGNCLRQGFHFCSPSGRDPKNNEFYWSNRACDKYR